jgi:6-phosphofructokinase 2
MTQILTVTLNPALDLSTSADGIRPGPKLRCDDPVREPGGGGVNVARVIRRLGGDCVALVALGGPTGAALRGLLDAEGVPSEVFAVPGDTRLGLAVTDRSTGAQFRFVLPGPSWTPAMAHDLCARVGGMARKGGLVVLSGSQPPGAPDDLPAALAAVLRRADARLVVDTSGAALRRLAAGEGAGIEVLRIDEAEAEELAGRPLPDRAASLAFAASLVARGTARVVVLARGAEGSVLAAPGLALAAAPPVVPVLSKVGAGDSFAGAFVRALALGLGLDAALVHGTAAAAAAVMTPATELCRRADFERLLPEVRLQVLSGGGEAGAASAR